MSPGRDDAGKALPRRLRNCSLTQAFLYNYETDLRKALKPHLMVERSPQRERITKDDN
jgi:hypothetical protein